MRRIHSNSLSLSKRQRLPTNPEFLLSKEGEFLSNQKEKEVQPLLISSQFTEP